MDFLADVDLFDNRQWNDELPVEDQFLDAKNKLKKLSAFYNLPYTDEVYDKFVKLVKTLFEINTPWCEIKQSFPSAFWMTILNRRHQFDIDGTLESLIENLMVTPMGKMNFLP